MPLIDRRRRTLVGLLLALGAALSVLLPAEAGAWRVFNNVGIDSQHVGVCGDGVRLRVVAGGEGVGGVSGGTIVVDVTAGTPFSPPALPDGIVAHAELTPGFSPIFFWLTGLPKDPPPLYRSNSGVFVVPFAQPLAVGTEVRFFAHQPQDAPSEMLNPAGGAWVVDDCEADAPGLCDGLEPTITGTNGPDVLGGTAGDDVILARGGADMVQRRRRRRHRLCGQRRDVVNGGSGVDRLLGEGGADQLLDPGSRGGSNALLGGDGADVLRGGGAIDALAGGAGADDLSGGGAGDGLYGGTGPDVLLLDKGDDWLNGGAGIDTVSADTPAVTAGPVQISLTALSATAPGLGDDQLEAGRIENLRGSPFNDLLIGDAGANVLRGLGSDDRLDGRAGTDTLHGGSGSDSCINGEVLTGCEF